MWRYSMSMDFQKPMFQLSRVFDDGSSEELEVVPVTSLDLGVSTDRRGALGAGVTISTLLAALTGCGEKRPPVVQTPPPPKPTASTKGPLKAHRTAISGLTLAPDGTLVTAGQDEGLKLWSFPSGEMRSPFNTKGLYKNGFQALLVTPDGKRLVTETHDLLADINVKSYPDGESVATLSGHKEPVQSLSVSGDSRTLASGSADRTARLWSLADAKPLATFEGHTGPVSGVQISPDGATLYSGSDDGSVRLWSIPDKKYMRSLQPAVPPVSDLVLSPDGRLLAAGSRDGTVNVWSVPDGTLRTTTKYHTGRVRSVQIEKDGDTVISGSEDGTIKRWSVKDKRVIDEIAENIGLISRILLSPDGLLLIIGSALGIVMIWDLLARKARSFLFDRLIAAADIQGITYSVYDSAIGRVITYTLPCGSPLPPGATCTCNCVAGKEPVAYRPEPLRVPVQTTPSCSCVSVCRCVPQSICSCERVCSCVPQRICTCERVCTCVPQCICLAVRRP
jgi:WD40 repeat protein